MSLQSLFSSKKRYLPVGLSFRGPLTPVHTFDLITNPTISVHLLEPRIPWHGRVFPKVCQTKMAPHQAHGDKHLPGLRQLHPWVQPKTVCPLPVCPDVGRSCRIQQGLAEHICPPWRLGTFSVRCSGAAGGADGFCHRTSRRKRSWRQWVAPRNHGTRGGLGRLSGPGPRSEPG